MARFLTRLETMYPRETILTQVDTQARSQTKVRTGLWRDINILTGWEIENKVLIHQWPLNNILRAVQTHLKLRTSLTTTLRALVVTGETKTMARATAIVSLTGIDSTAMSPMSSLTEVVWNQLRMTKSWKLGKQRSLTMLNEYLSRITDSNTWGFGVLG